MDVDGRGASSARAQPGSVVPSLSTAHLHSDRGAQLREKLESKAPFGMKLAAPPSDRLSLSGFAGYANPRDTVPAMVPCTTTPVVPATASAAAPSDIHVPAERIQQPLGTREVRPLAFFVLDPGGVPHGRGALTTFQQPLVSPKNVQSRIPRPVIAADDDTWNVTHNGSVTAPRDGCSREQQPAWRGQSDSTPLTRGVAPTRGSQSTIPLPSPSFPSTIPPLYCESRALPPSSASALAALPLLHSIEDTKQSTTAPLVSLTAEDRSQTTVPVLLSSESGRQSTTTVLPLGPTAQIRSRTPAPHLQHTTEAQTTLFGTAVPSTVVASTSVAASRAVPQNPSPGSSGILAALFGPRTSTRPDVLPIDSSLATAPSRLTPLEDVKQAPVVSLRQPVIVVAESGLVDENGEGDGGDQQQQCSSLNVPPSYVSSASPMVARASVGEQQRRSSMDPCLSYIEPVSPLRTSGGGGRSETRGQASVRYGEPVSPVSTSAGTKSAGGGGAERATGTTALPLSARMKDSRTTVRCSMLSASSSSSRPSEPQSVERPQLYRPSACATSGVEGQQLHNGALFNPIPPTPRVCPQLLSRHATTAAARMQQTQKSTDDGHNDTVRQRSTEFGREASPFRENIIVMQSGGMESYQDDAAMDELSWSAAHSESADEDEQTEWVDAIYQPETGQRAKNDALICVREKVFTGEEDCEEDVKLSDSSHSDDWATAESAYEPGVKKNDESADARMSYSTMTSNVDEDVAISHQSDLQEEWVTEARNGTRQSAIGGHKLEDQSRCARLSARTSATYGGAQKKSNNIEETVIEPVDRANKRTTINDTVGRQAFSDCIIVAPGGVNDNEITVEVRDRRTVSHIPLTVTIEERAPSRQSMEQQPTRTYDDARPTTAHRSTVQDSPANPERHPTPTPLYHANRRSLMLRSSTSPWSFPQPRDTQDRRKPSPARYAPSEQHASETSPHQGSSTRVRERSSSAPRQKASSTMSPQRQSTLIASARKSLSPSTTDIPRLHEPIARTPEWDSAIAWQWDSERPQRVEKHAPVRWQKGAMVGDQPRSPNHAREPPQPHVEEFRDTIRRTLKTQVGPPAPMLGSTTGLGSAPLRATATTGFIDVTSPLRHENASGDSTTFRQIVLGESKQGTRSSTTQNCASASNLLHDRLVASTTRSAEHDGVHNSSQLRAVACDALVRHNRARQSSTGKGADVLSASPPKRTNSAGTEHQGSAGRGQPSSGARNRSVSEKREKLESSRLNESQQQQQRLCASEGGTNAKRSPQRASANQKQAGGTKPQRISMSAKTRGQQPSHDGNAQSVETAAASRIPANAGHRRNKEHGAPAAASRGDEDRASLASQPNVMRHALPNDNNDDDAVVNAARRETAPVYFPGGDTTLRGSVLSIGGARGKAPPRASQGTELGADSMASPTRWRATARAAQEDSSTAPETRTKRRLSGTSASRRRLPNNIATSSEWPLVTTTGDAALPAEPLTKVLGWGEASSPAHQQIPSNISTPNTRVPATEGNDAWKSERLTRTSDRGTSESPFRRHPANSVAVPEAWPETSTQGNDAWPAEPPRTSTGCGTSMPPAQQPHVTSTVLPSAWSTALATGNDAWPTAPPTTTSRRETPLSPTRHTTDAQNVLLEERRADEAHLPAWALASTNSKASTEQLARARGTSKGPRRKKKHAPLTRPSNRSSTAAGWREEESRQGDSPTRRGEAGRDAQAPSSAVNIEEGSAPLQDADDGIGLTEWECEMKKIVRDSQRWRRGFDRNAHRKKKAVENDAMVVEQPVIEHTKEAK